MKKINQPFLILIVAMLTFTFTSCNETKAKNDASSNETTDVRNENQTFIVKYEGQDWEINNAEWEAWKADPSNDYDKHVALDKDMLEVTLPSEGPTGYFEAASLADQIDKIIDMQMVGVNQMPMKAVQLIEAKAKYLAYAKKGF